MPKDNSFSSQNDTTKLLGYWRASVSDSMFGKGRLTAKSLRGAERFSAQVLESGRMPPRLTAKIFEGRDEHEGSVPVRFWPWVYARQVNHGTARQDGLPDALAPIVSEAVVTRAGNILPGRTLIPRDLLEPLAAQTLSIGSVEDQDKFLANGGFAGDVSIKEHAEGWEKYLEFCDLLLREVTQDWFEQDDVFTERNPGFFEVADDASAMVRGILSLYDDLAERDKFPALMRNYARITPNSLTASVAHPYLLAERLGHPNDVFATAQNQHDVLAHMAKMQHGDIIAVNGPPGTGKTTMLLSAIAGEWVRAAAEESVPPVIVAASANNQAVTNIIDAFGKDYAVGTGPFAGRWLPDIKSFGLFLASSAREDDAAKTYQTERFVKVLESEAYVAKATAAYLSKAREALGDPAVQDVEEITRRLRNLIREKKHQLEQIDQTYGEKMRAQSALDAELGDDPEARLAERHKRLDASKTILQEIGILTRRWDVYLSDESSLLALFSFLPFVARKRMAAVRRMLRDAGFSELAEQILHFNTVETEIRKKDADAKAENLSASTSVERAEAVLDAVKTAIENFQRATRPLSEELSSASLDDIDAYVDCHVRFPLFLLATHYWEGRWLLEMQDLLPDLEKEQKGRGKKTIIPRWRRRMMLTPCAVATFATLPSKMSFRRSVGKGAFADDYLYDFIDLLIVDEAGQILPEIAAPSFALAKKALVVGDTRQIEPISNIPKAIDLGNLEKFDVLSQSMGEDAQAKVLEAGFVSHSGSVMACAQDACRYQPYPDLDRGLYLFEHRRCFDEIIGFCNTLCYRGHLQPKRGAANNIDFPPMGYLHIDGEAYLAGGSRFNPAEAQTIAAWIVANRAPLETKYKQKIENILAIVTPFGRQAQELRQACGAVGIHTRGAGAMTIGTVHALQGAERPVVLFSPTYAKGMDGTFIDSSASMLNVAVSRAKDNFLVFGDMDMFSTAPEDSPRAILRQYLFKRPENALEFDVRPRAELKMRAADVRVLRDADDHDVFLHDTLVSAKHSVEIVSPWVIKATMEKNGFLSLMQEAVARGVQIDIYADPKLNERIVNQGLTQYDEVKLALREVGVTLHSVRQLHSKIVTADDDIFCLGSYNWLSADRAGKYARHETSLVYSGSHMAKEIARFRSNLGIRSV